MFLPYMYMLWNIHTQRGHRTHTALHQGSLSNGKDFGEEAEAPAGSLGPEICDFSREEWVNGTANQGGWGWGGSRASFGQLLLGNQPDCGEVMHVLGAVVC